MLQFFYESNVLLVLIYFGTLMTLRVQPQMLSGLDVSIAWSYSALPVGSGFTLIAVVARLVAQFKGGVPIAPTHEGERA